jgi:putative FmdB family regulatory protein
MPKYKYRCNACREEWETWHRINSKPRPCSCGEGTNLQRLPPVFTRTKINTWEKKVGDATKEHIEEAKRDLQSQKEEATKEEID